MNDRTSTNSVEESARTQEPSPLLGKTYVEYLRDIEDPRRDAFLQFYEDHRELVEAFRGSKTKHHRLMDLTVLS